MDIHYINKLKRLFFSYVRKSSTGINEAVNVVDSFSNAKKLYKELSKKCHPDLYINNSKKDIAEKLFQELQDCKYNYNEMLSLKEQILALWESRE